MPAYEVSEERRIRECDAGRTRKTYGQSKGFVNKMNLFCHNIIDANTNHAVVAVCTCKQWRI